MENLTWTGSLGTVLNPALAAAAALFAIAVVMQIATSLVVEPYRAQTLPDGRLSRRGGVLGLIERAPQYLLWALILIVLGYLVGGMVAPYGVAGILGAISKQLTPVWLALAATFVVSIIYKRKLGLYGKLFDSTVGMIGFGIVMFWVYTAFFSSVGGMIATHDPLSQVSGLKNKLPGTAVPDAADFAVGAQCL
jgi:peptide/nickel transport system permease protein